MNSPNPSRPTVLVALGGNALIQKGQKGTFEEQSENLKVPLRQVAVLSQKYRLIITHGNGPQVGALLLQQESCTQTPRMPLEILVAQTQGQIGYMIESTLDNQLMELGLDAVSPLITTVLTYVVVDKNDPMFANPTKPIGPSFTAEEAAGLPYLVAETAKGFRRMAASPEPLTIVERREIKRLVDDGFIVICGGGGGIPVIREGRGFSGVDAVIDKDLVSALLATEIAADVFIIATDVPGVYKDFGKVGQTLEKRISTARARELLSQGRFHRGSMGNKIEAAVRFIESGGPRAVITSVEKIQEAVAGLSGTEIIAGENK